MYSIVVPLRNAESFIPLLLPSLIAQQNCDEIIIVDSDSTDATARLLSYYPISYIHILSSQFNHGSTRDMAMRLAKNDIVVFLTQDALPISADTIRNLVSSFENPSVGLVYGRQLPRPEAMPIEAHARLFNYPEKNQLKSFEDRTILGIKTTFCSNSFSAYRKSAYESVGGFPSNVILSEDTFIAAKMLKNGYRIAYNADACVYHSHGYTIFEEFSRYFDTGVFHARESWIRDEFGGAEGEGTRFVKSEISYLMKNAPYLIPHIFIRNFMKFLGYRLGLVEKILPLYLKRNLGMNKRYWD